MVIVSILSRSVERLLHTTPTLAWTHNDPVSILSRSVERLLPEAVLCGVCYAEVFQSSAAP